MLDSLINLLPVSSGLKTDFQWRKFLIQWGVFSLVLHLFSAIFSSGFYHSDEHFQILEFLNYKLGGIPQAELPLEFHKMLRPWLAPFMGYEFSYVLRFFGISNPFVLATCLRVFASLIGWSSFFGIGLCCYTWIQNTKTQDRKWRERAIIALSLLWYVPAFHARYSSENLGGALFFIGIAVAELVPENYLISFIQGVLFGLAFECRYQVGLMIFGALAWRLRSFFGLTKVRYVFLNLVSVLAGIAIIFVIGSFIDRWGYGQWTCAPWNYFKYNVIQNHVADVDTSPAWDYFRRAFTEAWPFLGLLLLLSFVVAWVRHPKHILTWSCVPFFIVHLLIGHKELRFLFPLVHIGGVLLVFSFYPFFYSFKVKAGSWLSGWIIKPLLVINIIGLLCTSFIPAWMPIRFYQKIYDRAQVEGGIDLSYYGPSPYDVGGAAMYFYRPKGLHLHQLDSGIKPVYLFYSKASLPPEISQLQSSCIREFSAFPARVFESFDRINRQLIKQHNIDWHVTNWTLFRCQNI